MREPMEEMRPRIIDITNQAIKPHDGFDSRVFDKVQGFEDKPYSPAIEKINTLLDQADSLTSVVDRYHYDSRGHKAGEERGRALTNEGKTTVANYAEWLKQQTLDTMIDNYSLLAGVDEFGEKKEIQTNYTLAEQAVRRSALQIARMQLNYRVQDIMNTLAPEQASQVKAAQETLNNGQDEDEKTMIQSTLILAKVLKDAQYDVPDKQLTGTLADFSPVQEQTVNENKGLVKKLYDRGTALFRIAAVAAQLLGPVSPAQASQEQQHQYSEVLGSVGSEQDMNEWIVTPTPAQKKIVTPTPAHATPAAAQPQPYENPLQQTPPTGNEMQNNRVSPAVDVEVAQTRALPIFEFGNPEHPILLKEKDGGEVGEMVTFTFPGLGKNGTEIKFRPSIIKAGRDETPFDQAYASTYALSSEGPVVVGVHDLYVKLDPADPGQKAVIDAYVRDYGKEYCKNIEKGADQGKVLCALAGEFAKKGILGSREGGLPGKTLEEIQATLKKINEGNSPVEMSSASGGETQGSFQAFYMSEQSTNSFYQDRHTIIESIKKEYGDVLGVVDKDTVLIVMCAGPAKGQNAHQTEENTRKAESNNLLVIKIQIGK